MHLDLIFWLGVLGGVILVLGSMYPSKKIPDPKKSFKNWCFATGAICLLIFAILDFYFNGAPFFFVVLEILVLVATILMFLNTDDVLNTKILTIIGISCLVWSFFLFEDFSTLFFIFGLLGIAIGYALEAGTFRRNMALFFWGGLGRCF